MAGFWGWVAFLLGDAVLLYTFQVAVAILFIFAEMNDGGLFNKKTGAYATTTRGAESWNLLSFAFGIIAVNVLQIINSADDSTKFKVLMSGFDLVVMIRLFYFNGWFRNKTLGVIGIAQTLEEGKRAMPKPATPERGPDA
jgi:hypothetical protein